MFSVLAVEIDGMTLRAAVLRRNFRGIAVSDCLQLDRAEESEMITAAELSMITSRIAKCPKSAVVVSPLAAVIELAMDSKRMRKLKSSRLKEALRWEAEPYMVIPAAESLVGYEVGFETGEGQTGVRVSVMLDEDYRSLKKVFAECNLRLKKVYPPDVCFPVGAVFAGKEKDWVVVDVGRQAMKFALVEDGKITAFRTLPAGLAASRAHLDGLPSAEPEPSLKEIFEAWGVAGRKVLLTGPGGLEAGVVEFFRQKMGADAAVLHLQAGGDFTPAFASALGAGLRQIYLRGGWKSAGVDDGVELARLIRQRVQVLPVAAVLAVVVLFCGHYVFLKQQLSRCNAEVGALQAQKESYSRLKNEAEEIEKQILTLKKKLDFLQGSALDKEKVLWALLSTLARSGPADFTLKKFEPLGDDLYSVQGECSSPASVNVLAMTLQGKEWCRQVNIESISRRTATEKITEKIAGSGGEKEMTAEVANNVYEFSIKVLLDAEARPADTRGKGA
ncbi:MAG: PilN domain-containing protein [Armatimonadetes bacterium]|nr:PilN domain-containing protein [Armatimonadota bacterium]